MNRNERDEKLKALLTNDFLNNLHEVARLAGWTYCSDYFEVGEFVKEMFDLADTECPDLEPYDYED